jgi:hypothetical protein
LITHQWFQIGRRFPAFRHCRVGGNAGCLAVEHCHGPLSLGAQRVAENREQCHGSDPNDRNQHRHFGDALPLLASPAYPFPIHVADLVID